MADPKHLDWDDVRIFLALMRAGSLSGAAVRLGVSRPTAGRRLTALEAGFGLKLFRRRPDGLHPTDEAANLLDAAEGVERAMLTMSRAAHAADPEVRGPVHVSVPAAVATELLMLDLVEFCRRWPLIDLKLSGSYDLVNLAQREADVAIRFVPRGQTPDAELTGRMAGTAYTAAYGFGDCWIGQRGAELDNEWVLQSDFPDLPVRGAIIDGHSQRSACAAGMGLARLPCFIAEPLLTRRSVPKPELDIWVLVHPDLRHNRRLRIFRDAMVESLRRHRPRLEGRERCGPVSIPDKQVQQ